MDTSGTHREVAPEGDAVRELRGQIPEDAANTLNRRACACGGRARQQRRSPAEAKQCWDGRLRPRPAPRVKRSIWIFLLAILLPSIGLGWLALRSANEQQIILERRTAELYQKETDAVASAARSLIEEERRAFAERVRQMLAGESAPELARDFAAKLTRTWPRAAIGFALNRGRRSYFAFRRGSAGRRRTAALSAKQRRLSLRDDARDRLLRSGGGIEPAGATAQAEERIRRQGSRTRQIDREPQAICGAGSARLPRTQTEVQKDESRQESAQMRNVAPQKVPKEMSGRLPARAGDRGFQSAYLRSPGGSRHALHAGPSRDCLLAAAAGSGGHDLRLSRERRRAQRSLARLRSPDNASPDSSSRLLNDKARPVATQPPGDTGRDWRRPFVASEIGEALPHWEAALYLMRPQQLQENARNVRRTLMLLIAAALGAIAVRRLGRSSRDARRQLALAQKKTDFVSNVSHELKTPLTSIRMFAELMQSGNAAPKRSARNICASSWRKRSGSRV